MRVALAVLVAALLVIADITFQCTGRGSGGRKEADWEIAIYLAVVVGLGGAGWTAAAAVPAGRRLARLTWPIAQYGAKTALVCGLATMAVVSLCAVVSGVGSKELWDERYNLECFWLFAATLGGLSGSAVGAGIGVAAYRSRHPHFGPTDTERENYREGPADSPTEETAVERSGACDAGRQSS